MHINNRLRAFLCGFALLSGWMAGCADPPGSCVAGGEACACHEGACFAGLICLSNVCVDDLGSEPDSEGEDTGGPPGSSSLGPEPEGPTSGNPTGPQGPTGEPGETGEPGAPDNDGDGWSADVDCDDDDPRTFPLREGDGELWATNLITKSATICPGRYHRAGIEVVGADVLLSGYGVVLDGDGFDYTDDGYIFPFIYVHEADDCRVAGFRIEDFRGKTIALYAGDSGAVTVDDLYVTDFVQSAGGGAFGTIYARLVTDMYVGGCTVDGAMGRITMVGNSLNQVFACNVFQAAATYPEGVPSPMPAGIHVSGATVDGWFTPGGETYIAQSVVSVVDGTSAIYLHDGFGGSIIDNTIECGFNAPQYGVASDSDHSKLIVQNSIDACWNGIAGFGGSSGNQIENNVITDSLDECIFFDAAINTVGPNTCI